MSLGTAQSLSTAMRVATDFVSRFSPTATIAGSIRRGAKEVHDIDLMTPEPLDAIKARLFEAGIPITRDGEKSLYATYEGLTVNIYFYEPEYQGAMIWFLTGPKNYTIGYRMKAKKKGWVLNQYGLFDALGKRVAGETEEGLYKALDKEWKDPILRGKK